MAPMKWGRSDVKFMGQPRVPKPSDSECNLVCQARKGLASPTAGSQPWGDMAGPEEPSFPASLCTVLDYNKPCMKCCFYCLTYSSGPMAYLDFPGSINLFLFQHKNTEVRF